MFAVFPFVDDCSLYKCLPETNYATLIILCSIKIQLIKTLAILLLPALPGCSSVQIYSDSGMTRKAGLKYYYVKAYMQVARNSADNTIIKLSVVYLPDLENPQYVLLKNRLGSKKFDIKLGEGAITSFRLDNEPLAADSFEALAALISETTSAVKSLSALK